MKIVMIGATGLVGSAVVPMLPDQQLTLVGRRTSGHPGIEEIVRPAAEWPDAVRGRTFDVAISALGTTWKKAGDWQSFEAIDRHAVTGFAAATRSAGARQMILVSSVGADAGSSNGYLAIKGRAEADLEAIGFPRLDILRPGLLRGLRGDDRRWGERAGITVSPLVNALLHGRFRKFRAIDAATVARAIANLALASDDGFAIHHNDSIQRWAGRPPR